MTETANIAEIAAKVSKELFGTFLWETHGPIDQEWPCEEPENHRPSRRRRGANRGASDDSENNRGDEAECQSVPVVKHPTDIVFYYDEPYSNHRTYINCDLKELCREIDQEVRGQEGDRKFSARARVSREKLHLA
jgi:hypothetical protein